MNPIRSALVAICAVGCGQSLAAESSKSPAPNVVRILADDLGYGDVGCYGATKIRTPNIDQLAREGRSFANAYTPGCVCSPARYDWSREEIKPGPLEVGFDYFYGMAANVGNAPRIHIESHRFVGRKPGDVVTMIGRGQVKPWSPDAETKEEHVAGDIARQAVQFIERSKDKAFFPRGNNNAT